MEQGSTNESALQRILYNVMRGVRHALGRESNDSSSLDSYQALYDLSRDGMLITDGPQIVSLNQSMVRMLGYESADELIGRDVNDFTPQSMRGRFANIYQLNATGPYVLELIRKDGSFILVEFTGRNVFQFGRKLRAAVVHDLTESKTGVKPAVFAQSEKRFHQVFNASPSTMAITTIRDGVHLEVNKAWERLIGIDREYALGRKSVDLGVWHSLEARARFVDEINRRGFVKDFVTKFNVQGGKVIELSISAEPINFDDTECMIMTGFDVSDRHRADHAATKLKIEMEKMDNLQSKFLANMSHELRVPLNTIVGYSSGLTDGVWGRIEDERHKTYMKAIKTSGELLVALVDDLLDMSRLESGKLPLYMEPTDVGAIVHLSVQELDLFFQDAGIEVDVSIGENMTPIALDQSRTKQAIKNVLTNARRYTPKGGEVHVHLYEAMGVLMIVIEDNGVGLNETNLKSVFEPFSTNLLARDDDDVRNGSRLGMPLAKALIEVQGGQIELSSTFGEGTRVVISLPILDPSASHLD